MAQAYHAAPKIPLWNPYSTPIYIATLWCPMARSRLKLWLRAPKPMAMEIIEGLEPSRRGIYGGCVGYFDFAGNLDTAIAIRSAVLKNGKAYVQAGAGVVADSVAASEDAECQAKAAAVLRAVAAAEHG